MIPYYLRRRCCGCVLVLLMLVLLAALMLGFGVAWGVRAAHASPTATVSNAVLLAPGFTSGPHARQARGVFYDTIRTVTVPAPPVWLAASPDAQADLCVDDQVTLIFTQAEHQSLRWSHRFSSADRQRIACLAPQEISAWLHPGQYQVQVVFEDRLPPTYSARPLFLVFGESRSVTPTLAAQVIPQRSATPRATLARGAIVAITAAPSAQPTVPAPRPRTTMVTPGAGRTRAAPAAPPDTRWGALVALSLAGLVLSGVLLVRGRHTGRSPPLHGVLDLADTEAGTVCTALLDLYPHGAAITRDPLEITSWSPRALSQPERALIAYVLPTAQGIVLRDVDTHIGEIAIQPDRVYGVANGAVTVRFRH